MNNQHRARRVPGKHKYFKIMNTLEKLRDFINSHEDWELEANKAIEENGWNDEIGEDYGICSDQTHRLAFDGNMVAHIVAK